MASVYYARLVELARQNRDYRRVVYTGQRSQIVLMSLPPGGTIGWEQHPYVEQTFVFVSGTGAGLIGDEQYTIEPGIGMTVPPGVRHNIVNTGAELLQLFTIYAPPNHLDQRVHPTRAAAYADHQDAAYGAGVRERHAMNPTDSSRTAWALVGIGISFGLVFALVAAIKPQPQPAAP